jgi:prepilin peptidase CpaA
VIAALTIVFAGLFIASAVTDILYLRIPNAFVLALVALFAAACIVMPPKSILMGHVAPAVVVFALMAGLFYLGKLGGGDVKLLSAAVLWIGLAKLGPFLIALSLFGALAILVFAVFRTQVAAALAWTGVRLGRAIPAPASLETGKSIPYGVVIAAAALSVGPGALGGMT